MYHWDSAVNLKQLVKALRRTDSMPPCLAKANSKSSLEKGRFHFKSWESPTNNFQGQTVVTAKYNHIHGNRNISRDNKQTHPGFGY